MVIESKKTKIGPLVLLFLLLVTGGFLRIWGLANTSFWVDEVNTVYAAQNYVTNGKMELPSGMKYERAQIYTYTVAWVYKYFGVNETTSRLPSAFFGIGCILLAYLLGSQLGGRQVGLMSAFLVAFSHFEVGWSRVSRMYTLLQLMTLIASYAFLKGFESGKTILLKATTAQKTVYVIKQMLWVAVSFAIIALAAFKVHYLALFIPVALTCYVVSHAFYSLFSGQGYGKWMNRYSIGSLLIFIFTIVVWYAVPLLRDKAQFFLAYTPPWATGLSSAQDKLYLFDFLVSPFRFPIAAFFFIGAVQCIIRRRTKGWLYLWFFIVPLFLLSFLFTHRKPTYLFYVYPYFLILSAYGFVNMVKSEWDWLKTDFSIEREKVKKMLLLLFGFIFILAPWFRVTWHIPFQGDGMTNWAVTHDEWRQAVQIVHERKQPDDLIISSLPQVSMYYGLNADYGLNWANLAQSRDKQFVKNGQLVDVYAGTPFISSTAMLDSLVQHHRAGWILITKYHFDHAIVIPEDVREYVIHHFGEPILTDKSSVLIFQWLDQNGAK